MSTVLTAAFVALDHGCGGKQMGRGLTFEKLGVVLHHQTYIGGWPKHGRAGVTQDRVASDAMGLTLGCVTC